MIQHMVHKRGALIKSADGVGNGVGPQDELMRDITLAMAKYERALIIMRTREALRSKRLKGEKCGGDRPYGFQIEEVDGTKVLVRDDVETNVICHMQELRDAGNSYALIASTLNGEGLPTSTGGLWYANSVRRVLIRASGNDDEN